MDGFRPHCSQSNEQVFSILSAVLSFFYSPTVETLTLPRQSNFLPTPLTNTSCSGGPGIAPGLWHTHPHSHTWNLVPAASQPGTGLQPKRVFISSDSFSLTFFMKFSTITGAHPDLPCFSTFRINPARFSV